MVPVSNRYWDYHMWLVCDKSHDQLGKGTSRRYLSFRVPTMYDLVIGSDNIVYLEIMSLLLCYQLNWWDLSIWLSLIYLRISMFLTLLYLGSCNGSVHTIGPLTAISKYLLTDLSILTRISKYFSTDILHTQHLPLHLQNTILILNKYLQMCFIGSIHASHHLSHTMVHTYLVIVCMSRVQQWYNSQNCSSLNIFAASQSSW